MYKIIGVDGKEYGPVSLEQLREWIAQGRVNAQTRVQGPASAEWKSASEVPEISALLSTPVIGPTPPSLTPPPFQAPTGPQQTGLAITSFVLGLLSMLCFGLITGIPAIICGHIAHNRARRSPSVFGGSGFAIAGFVLGYLSIFMTLLLAGLLLPALAKSKQRSQSIQCANNMKQIGLAFRIWENDHESHYPFAVSTNSGGTLEFRAPGPQGFDRNAALHFQVLSNELASPNILLCPSDHSKKPATDFQRLGPANLTYRLRTAAEGGDANPRELLLACPIHGNVLRADGSIDRGKTFWR